MMNELFGNYLNVLGFRVFMVVLFLAAVIDLLVRANFRMKRKSSPFNTPRLWMVGLTMLATVLVHFRNGNFELIYLNYGVIDLFLAYLLDLPLLAVVVVVYARVLTIVSFIVVSLAFELSPAINRVKVLRLYFASWSLKKSLLKA